MRFLMALVAAMVVGVAGASAVMGSTDPVTAPGPADLEPDGSGAAIVATTTDPGDGGAAAARSASSSSPRWAVRVYRSESGATCPDVNRTVGGDFGRVDGDGTFHPLPLEASGECAVLTAADPYTLAIRHMPANDERGPRAIVFGVVGSGVSSVAMTTDGTTQDVPIAGGAYVAAFTEDEVAETSVTVTLSDGTHETTQLQADPANVATP